MRNCKCDWEQRCWNRSRDLSIYLGGLITEDGRCEEDVKRRIGLACAALGELGKNVERKEHLRRNQNETLLRPGSAVLLYGSECWSLRKEDERRLLVAEMSWLRRIRSEEHT